MYPKLAIDVFGNHLVFARIDNLVAIDIVEDKVTGRVGHGVEMYDTRLVGAYPQLAQSVDVDVVNGIVAQRLAIGYRDVPCFVERQRNEEETIGGRAGYEASRGVTTQELDGGTGLELEGLHFTIALADMENNAVSRAYEIFVVGFDKLVAGLVGDDGHLVGCRVVAEASLFGQDPMTPLIVQLQVVDA